MSKYKSLILMCLCSLSMVLSGLVSKKIITDPITMNAFQSQGTLIMLLPYAWYQRKNDRKIFEIFPINDKQLLFCIILRGITGIIGGTCLFQAFKLLPIGDVTCFFMSHSVIVTILAWKIMHETMTKKDIFHLSLSLLGCFCVAQPKALINYLVYGRFEDGVDGEILLRGIFFSVMTMVFLGLCIFFIKLAGDRTHFISERNAWCFYMNSLSMQKRFFYFFI